MLLVRMAEACVLVVFVMLRNLTVSFLLGSFFINWFVKKILPAQRRIVPYSLQPVQILLVDEASDDSRTIASTTNETYGSLLAVVTEEQEEVVRVVGATTIQPMFETLVLVNTNASGAVQGLL